MKQDRIIDTEKMQILSVKTLKGSIEADAGIDTSHIVDHSFNFVVGHGMDIEQKLIGIELKIDIEAIDNANKSIGVNGSYTHEVIFSIDNMDDFIDPAEKVEDTVMDLLLMATLVGIAYSTIRGIIFCRTQGTSLGTVILPVVDPKKMLGVKESSGE